ncbi:MAG: DNA modification methylase [Lachnospiraceae bacterium]|nr:DNA modification methylase [Lachnospiraceae bacterium]
MVIKKIAVARLNPAAYNPRRELKPGDKDYEKLKRSIEEFGFVEPVVWNEATGNVVGGHQRLRVLLDMGETEVDCVVVNMDSQKEKALNLALNRIQGGWDEAKLAEVMADLDASAFDVSLTGFDAEEVDALMNKFYSADAEEDGFDRDSAIEQVEAAGGAVTKPGDIWVLGSHRLMCGDPVDVAEMERLLDGQKAACCVTSLPCESLGVYKKDGIAPWLERMSAVIGNVCAYSEVVCCTFGDMFSTGSQFMEPVAFHSMRLFGERNFRPLWLRIWKKQGIVARMGSAHLTSAKPIPQYEYVGAFADKAVDSYNDQEFEWVSAFAGHSYQFVRRLTKEERRNWGYAGIWEVAAATAGKNGEPAVPVELPWRCMKMHSDVEGIILEPFSGFGTTLIAAEQSGRKCYAMDSDPLNCDLAVMRWEQFTGEKAVRVEKVDNCR